MTKDNWQTPKELFDKLNEEFNFDLDVCADNINSKCFFYIDEEKDALSGAWHRCGFSYSPPPVCWMNPPYSRNNIDKFCKKAFEESQRGCTVVGLLKLDTSTKWFHKYVMKAHELRFLTRRVRFIDPDTGEKGGSPPFGSVVVVWKPGIVDAPKVSAYDW